KGSGRSIKGLNLVDALVYCEDCLAKHGGHELAAGLSVTRENLEPFREKINEYATSHLTEEMMTPSLEAECCLSMEEITLELAQELRLLEPYGVDNPSPVFVLRSVTAEEIIPISNGKHTRLILGDGVNHIVAMFFSQETDELDFYPGEKVDVLFGVDINEWNGRKTVQLIVRDIHSAEDGASSLERDKKRFEEIAAGAYFSEAENVVPVREDFAAVYTMLRKAVHCGTDVLSIRLMMSRLKSDGIDIGYVKMKFIFRIFEELNLLGISEIAPDEYRFKLRFSGSKADLEKSNILRLLRIHTRPAR
ncbi:MAG: DHHA1 domain-containing protein, partial [Clostridia bacterium]|nr:DHHA1 domain-containing protein [Clostridia bacterium]